MYKSQTRKLFDISQMSKRRASMSAKAPPAKRQKTTTDKVKTLETKVNRLSRNLELKQIETFETTSMIVSASGPTWAYIVGLSDMAQGVNDGQRIGNEISVKSIEVSLRITIPSSTIAGTSFRVVLLKDKHPNGSGSLAITNPYAFPTSPLEDLGSASANEVAVMLHKWDVRQRYTWYKDFVLNIQPAVVASTTVGSVTNNVVERFATATFKVPIKNSKVVYGGPNATNNDVQMGMFQLGIFGDQKGTNAPTIDCATRLIYTDK